MIYLLDANVLIDAHRDYYPISRVPEFWDWLVHQGHEGRIRVSQETFDEITAGREDDLTSWACEQATEEALLLDEDADPTVVSRIVDDGYAPDLTDEEIEKLGNDPFVIAYALTQHNGRCVVTTEVSRPSKRRANRKIPDVCHTFGISCCNTFKLLRDLNFSTNWRGGL